MFFSHFLWMFHNFITHKHQRKIHCEQGKETEGGEFNNVPSPEHGILLKWMQQLTAINDSSRIITLDVLSVTRWRLNEAKIFNNKPVLLKIETWDFLKSPFQFHQYLLGTVSYNNYDHKSNITINQHCWGRRTLLDIFKVVTVSFIVLFAALHT